MISTCLVCAGAFEAKTVRAVYCGRSCKGRWAWRATHPIVTRGCLRCATDITSKRSHALYCSRRCKTGASDARVSESGRGRTRDRLRYAKEGERRREYARDYHRTHPEQAKEIRLRRRARTRGAERFEVTPRDWRRLVARFRGCCAYCGVSAPLQRDHVQALARGGQHRVGNILPACAPCNYSKKDKFVVECRAKR